MILDSDPGAGIGTIVIIGGLVTIASGILLVVLRMRARMDPAPGFRLVYLGVAVTAVGAGVLLVSRPEDVLQLPGRIAAGAFAVLMAVRFGLSAYRQQSGRSPWHGDRPT
jgi:uncharacterized membrane protein HdeD (DUF308 family)